MRVKPEAACLSTQAPRFVAKRPAFCQHALASFSNSPASGQTLFSMQCLAHALHNHAAIENRMTGLNNVILQYRPVYGQQYVFTNMRATQYVSSNTCSNTVICSSFQQYVCRNTPTTQQHSMRTVSQYVSRQTYISTSVLQACLQWPAVYRALHAQTIFVITFASRR